MNLTSIPPVLGSLKFDETLNWYEGSYAIPSGENVPYTVSLDATESEHAALAEASELLPVVFELIQAGKQFACDSLLELKNQSWLEDGCAPLSAQEFVSMLQITSIGFFADKECEISFDDGGIFLGHTVFVSWNPTEGFYDTGIAG